MGLLDFLKSNKSIILASPLNGIVMPLSDMPDPTFAEKIIGDGVAINPTEQGQFCASSINSQGVIDVFVTGHAYTFELGSLEAIVHIGIETVSLKGMGFEALVESGKPYPINTDIIKIDRVAIEPKVPSLISALVVSNMDVVDALEILKPLGSTVAKGEDILKVTLKSP